MNHITEALDIIMQNWLIALLCVSVVILIAGIALMVGYERAENRAAWQQARAENREAKAIEAGRKLYEQAASCTSRQHGIGRIENEGIQGIQR